MEVTLRPAGPDDLAEVMALERSGFEPGVVEDEAVFARRIAAFPQGFLLASDGPGGPAWGYFCGELWDDWDAGDPSRFDLGHDIGAWHRPRGRCVYLASMTVAPEFRGGGRGRALFRAGLGRFRRSFPWVDEAVLIVNEHWAGARSIYRGEGFAETGLLPGFFRPDAGPRGDAVLMHRRLP